MVSLVALRSILAIVFFGVLPTLAVTRFGYDDWIIILGLSLSSVLLVAIICFAFGAFNKKRKFLVLPWIVLEPINIAFYYFVYILILPSVFAYLRMEIAPLWHFLEVLYLSTMFYFIFNYVITYTVYFGIKKTKSKPKHFGLKKDFGMSTTVD